MNSPTLTSFPASEDLASPPKAADCERSFSLSATPPGSATLPTTGPACHSSPMSTTLTPSSAQLWPSPMESDYKNKEWDKWTANISNSTKHHSSSPPAFRASLPVPPVSDREVQMTVGSGLRLSAWLPDSGPVGACLKTLLASPAWHSPLRSLTWTLKGYAGCQDEPSLKSSGDLTLWDMTCPATGTASLGFRVCRRSVSELSTDEIGSGLSPEIATWGTPRADEWKGCGPTGGKSHLHRLERDYLDAQAQSHVELLTTPTVRDSNSVAKCTRGAGSAAAGNELIQPLTVQADSFHPGPEPSLNAEPTESRGQLNPDFVCWLMGYPEGWLNYADLETQFSRSSQAKSSRPSRSKAE